MRRPCVGSGVLRLKLEDDGEVGVDIAMPRASDGEDTLSGLDAEGVVDIDDA